MSLMRQFQRYPAPALKDARKFIVAGRHVGWVKPTIAERLLAESDAFVGDAQTVTMHPRLATAEARSEAMAAVLVAWRKAGLVPGWRNELFPVNTGFDQPPLLTLERAATPLFGILTYGVNVNGFVGRGWGMRVWVATRAATKAIDPNMLDHIVGGGQPFGLTVAENLVKECWEEAGISAGLAAKAQSVGIVTLAFEAPHGLRIDQQFNFDLELPEDFVPANQDGEVAAFELIPVSELLHRLRGQDSFMFDSAVVNIDFLLRHGFIGPEDPHYLALVAAVRPALPYDKEGVVA